MKKILITGQNSYIGNSFEEWVSQWPDEYAINKVSLRDKSWELDDWSTFDVVYHVAGFVHKKETKDNRSEYYRINRDLTQRVATKSKMDGVKHFIFLSTMSVYGIQEGSIDYNTIEAPSNCYGKSKLEAEKLLIKMENEHFNVAIIRPPMVYGRGAPGNYNILGEFSKKTPIFPYIKNCRSMIYIDNLSEFVRILINEGSHGLFFPQNEEYVCTSDMVRIISNVHNKNIKFLKISSLVVKVLKFKIVKKIFGNLTYDKKMSNLDKFDYQVQNFKKSIIITEK